MRTVLLSGTLALTVISACGTPDATGKRPLGSAPPLGAASAAGALASQSAAPEPAGPVLSPAAKIALDAGNSAYRAKHFGDAIARYREASAASPEHAAPWFGIYMAATEMKNKPLADSAMAKVNTLSSDAAALNTHAEVARNGAKPAAGTSPAGKP
jgi:hypothetical protein